MRDANFSGAATKEEKDKKERNGDPHQPEECPADFACFDFADTACLHGRGLFFGRFHCFIWFSVAFVERLDIAAGDGEGCECSICALLVIENL